MFRPTMHITYVIRQADFLDVAPANRAYNLGVIFGFGKPRGLPSLSGLTASTITWESSALTW